MAFVVGAAPSLPGLAQSVSPTSVHVGVGARPYAFGWLLGFFATLGLYTGLSLVWRDKPSSVERAVGPDEVYDAQAPEDGSGSERWEESKRGSTASGTVIS